MDIEAGTRIVNANGLSFPVFDAGHGPAVLFLHGFPDSRFLWRHQIGPLLDAGYRVVAPDLRGFGDAPRPPRIRDYKLEIVTADVIGILDAIGVDRCAVVGHDWGAALTWFAAAAHPDRFDRVVALSVGVIGGNRGWRSPLQLARSWYFAFFQIPGLPEAVIGINNFRYLRAMLRNQGDIERYVQHFPKPGAISAGVNWYRANVIPQLFDAYSAGRAKFAMPVMGVWSDGDQFLTERQVTESKHLVSGPWRYEKITGAGHWMMLDKPNELNQLLLDFLK